LEGRGDGQRTGRWRRRRKSGRWKCGEEKEKGYEGRLVGHGKKIELVLCGEEMMQGFLHWWRRSSSCRGSAAKRQPKQHIFAKSFEGTWRETTK
jgi:hypothetical protein